MSREKQRTSLSAPKPADPGANAPLPSAPSGQPAPVKVPALLSIAVLLGALAIAVWVGRDLYAIVIEGEICRPRCQSWSTNAVSLVGQCVGCIVLMTMFLGLAYGALKFLIEPAGEDRV